MLMAACNSKYLDGFQSALFLICLPAAAISGPDRPANRNRTADGTPAAVLGKKAEQVFHDREIGTVNNETPELP